LGDISLSCKDFSPESDFRDYKNEHGEALFTPEESDYLNKVMLECYRFCALEVIDLNRYYSKMKTAQK
jgi:hypothetical protein